MKESIFNKLFIFEIANNHMGDLKHGFEIINQLKKVIGKFDFQFAIKFQYRNLDTFIHPDFKNRMDIKYVKRFIETRLSEADFLKLKNHAKSLGFVTVCTPFDEQSIELVEKHGYEIIKIASCSFTDWPLLERVAKTDKPIIASTAGASLEEIDKVVSFFVHRSKSLCLMHCVGSYPTPDDELELNQIDLFKNRYGSKVNVGFSTHEKPGNVVSVAIAIAKGVSVLERHVGVETGKHKLNAYSSSPREIFNWLFAAERAFGICGNDCHQRRKISQKEYNDLRGLKRGVFCKGTVRAGEVIGKNNIFYAIPNVSGQLLANDMSKYKKIIAKKNMSSNSPVLISRVDVIDKREKVFSIVEELVKLLKQSSLRLQNRLDLELSHHYGIDKFDKTGCSIINCVNREYCKKIIILLPGQENPTHYHKQKEETFHVLYGDLLVNLNGEEQLFRAGDLLVVERGMKHSFSSEHGAIFEEVSTTHYKNDSFYEDESIMDNKERKTELTFWSDWLD